MSRLCLCCPRRYVRMMDQKGSEAWFECLLIWERARIWLIASLVQIQLMIDFGSCWMIRHRRGDSPWRAARVCIQKWAVLPFLSNASDWLRRWFKSNRWLILGRVGFEPTTNWLKATCSTDWANDPCRVCLLVSPPKEVEMISIF